MDIQSEPVVVTPIQDGFRLRFAGPIHTNVSWLQREFDLVVAQKPKQVELDLTGTEYISSMGLGLIVGLYNRIKEAGGVVRVVAIPRPTFKLFKTAFLDRVLNIDPMR